MSAELPSLLEWMRGPELEKLENSTLLWKRSAIDQMLFFRDTIGPLFSLEHEFVVKIAGWHTSKSIKLPVYYVESSVFKVWARYNFYNWNVSVESKIPIHIPSYFEINRADSYLFFEGMGKEIQFPVYHPGMDKFSFCQWSKYDLYAICRFLTGQYKEVA